MAIICRSYNLLFIMTPRTACTAVGEALCSELGGEFLPGEDICAADGSIIVQKKHSTLDELLRHQILDKHELESLTKFCSVRNPFDSLVSLYLKKKIKYQPLLEDPDSWVHRHPGYAEDMQYCKSHSFDAWIRKVCYRKAIKRSLGLKPSMYRDFTAGMNLVMRYENLHGDFKNVLRAANVDRDVAIPLTNRTEAREGADYHSYYRTSSRRLVQYAYHHDLRTYDYGF